MSFRSAGVHDLGRIQLTMKYSVQRQRLIVVIHKIANIPLKDPSSIPDPYVKLYLLPERAKDSKRKTQVVKDNCNAVFDETFEYILSQGELNTKQLEVTVASQKQLFYSGSNILGMVVIDFEKLNISQPYTAWFDLNPESTYER
jgi:Ca2+-dependent lipid-binding protein